MVLVNKIINAKKAARETAARKLELFEYHVDGVNNKINEAIHNGFSFTEYNQINTDATGVREQVMEFYKNLGYEVWVSYDGFVALSWEENDVNKS